MNWESLTAPDFEKAVKTCKRVCVLPIGVIEKHGDHLPLGQDTLYIHHVCTTAAQKEPAIVFPFYYFGQIMEAQHVPGTIAIRSELMMQLLENVCDEIGRNGLERIIIVNGHGGNDNFLRYFAMTLLGKDKPYIVYISGVTTANSHDKAVRKAHEAAIDGHGGEEETSSMLHIYPELVHPERFGTYGLPLKRLQAFHDKGLYTGIWWYADYPGHFAGEKVKMTKEKGELFVNAHIQLIAEQIRLVKEDGTPLKLYREYRQRASAPANFKVRSGGKDMPGGKDMRFPSITPP